MEFQIKSLTIFTLFLMVPTIAIDLTIVTSSLNFSNSLGRIPIGWIECLKNDLKINVINCGLTDLSGITLETQSIITNQDKTPGTVSILLDHPIWPWAEPYLSVPKSKITIAQSMNECTLLPKKWVTILNTFDAIIVPDKSHIKNYRNSGIKKPIFVVPCGLYLDHLLSSPLKKKKQTPFIFGMSAGFWSWKNHKLVFEAFIAEFKNNPSVQLIFHSQFFSGTDNDLKTRILNEGIINVKILTQKFTTEEHANFLKSLDCYVFLSKGEGFSITPREAMALGIPCILSNNSAHKTICDTGLVRAVESNVKERAYNEILGEYCGLNFNCRAQDAREALLDVYKNYEKYLSKSNEAREWVKQYRYTNLKLKLINLIKPKKIILGKQDIVTNEFLMTRSRELYNKYVNIL